MNVKQVFLKTIRFRREMAKLKNTFRSPHCRYEITRPKREDERPFIGQLRERDGHLRRIQL